jgi:hypothetical protein
MYRFAVRQNNNSKVPTFGLRHVDLAPDSTVGLDRLANRLSNRAINPLIANRRPIGTHPNGFKVLGELHDANVTERARGSKLPHNVTIERSRNSAVRIALCRSRSAASFSGSCVTAHHNEHVSRDIRQVHNNCGFCVRCVASEGLVRNEQVISDSPKRAMTGSGVAIDRSNEVGRLPIRRANAVSNEADSGRRIKGNECARLQLKYRSINPGCGSGASGWTRRSIGPSAGGNSATRSSRRHRS